MVLTTECLVADKPEPAGAVPAAGRRRHGRHARHDVTTARVRTSRPAEPGHRVRRIRAARSRAASSGARLSVGVIVGAWRRDDDRVLRPFWLHQAAEYLHRAGARGDGAAEPRPGRADARRRADHPQRGARRRAARRLPAVLPAGPPHRRPRRDRRLLVLPPCCRGSTSTTPAGVMIARRRGHPRRSCGGTRRSSAAAERGRRAPAAPVDRSEAIGRARRARRRRHRPGRARPHATVRDRARLEASPVACAPWRSTDRPPTCRS